LLCPLNDRRCALYQATRPEKIQETKSFHDHSNEWPRKNNDSSEKAGSSLDLLFPRVSMLESEQDSVPKKGIQKTHFMAHRRGTQTWDVLITTD
jgi:hypothetical protein